ncbi:hypothetical protein NBRC10513v2_005766 [Rhodotorula toruloides]
MSTPGATFSNPSVIIVPPSVVLTRKNKNNVAEGQQVVTTVVDGKTETRTLDGVVATRTRLTTLANGQASTVTSFVALPDVTVSATSIDQIQTAFVTTTLTDGLVVVARTATNLQTEVATVTFTAGGGQVGTRTVTLTSLDIVTSDAYICFSVDHDASFDDEYKRELDFGIEHFEQRLVFVDPSALFLPHNFLLARLYNDHNVQRVPLLFVFGSLDIRFALEHRPANLFKHVRLLLLFRTGIDAARLVYFHDSSNYVPSPDDFWELLVEQYKPVVYDAAG